MHNILQILNQTIWIKHLCNNLAFEGINISVFLKTKKKYKNNQNSIMIYSYFYTVQCSGICINICTLLKGLAVFRMAIFLWKFNSTTNRDCFSDLFSNTIKHKNRYNFNSEVLNHSFSQPMQIESLHIN